MIEKKCIDCIHYRVCAYTTQVEYDCKYYAKPIELGFARFYTNEELNEIPIEVLEETFLRGMSEGLVRELDKQSAIKYESRGNTYAGHAFEDGLSVRAKVLVVADDNHNGSLSGTFEEVKEND